MSLLCLKLTAVLRTTLMKSKLDISSDWNLCATWDAQVEDRNVANNTNTFPLSTSRANIRKSYNSTPITRKGRRVLYSDGQVLNAAIH